MTNLLAIHRRQTRIIHAELYNGCERHKKKEERISTQSIAYSLFAYVADQSVVCRLVKEVPGELTAGKHSIELLTFFTNTAHARLLGLLSKFQVVIARNRSQ